jgi:hypothetical protein
MIRLTDLSLDTGISVTKTKHSARSRELTREKLGIILSIAEPECVKSRTLGNSLVKKRKLVRTESTLNQKNVGGYEGGHKDKDREDRDREDREDREGRCGGDGEGEGHVFHHTDEHVFNHKHEVISADLQKRFLEFGSKSIREYDERYVTLY